MTDKPLNEKRKEMFEKSQENVNESYYQEFNEGILHCLRVIQEQDKEAVEKLKEELILAPVYKECNMEIINKIFGEFGE